MVNSATADSGLEASRDDEVTSSQPSDIVVSAPEEPGLHGLPDDGLPAPTPSKNNQNPTSWGFHDVGLNDGSMVGVAGFEPTTSSSRTKRATKLRHTPCAASDSIASTHRREEIGSAESSVTSVFAPSRTRLASGGARVRLPVTGSRARRAHSDWLE